MKERNSRVRNIQDSKTINIERGLQQEGLVGCSVFSIYFDRIHKRSPSRLSWNLIYVSTKVDMYMIR